MTWIKMRSNLWNDPRIARLCDLTGKKEAEIIGALYWLWTMADEQTQDGRLDGLSTATIDRKTGVKGIGPALVDVGWVVETTEGVEIARFDEHNGASAKRRAYEAKRKQYVRSESANRPPRVQTKSGRGAELDKIRIDITPVCPQGDTNKEVDSKDDPPPPNDPILERVRSLFRMRPGTPLDTSATKAWQKNKKAAAALTEDEWSLLEWAYRQRTGPPATYRRRDIATLLNNITAEVLRARTWAGDSPTPPRPPAPVEPPGWRDLIESHYPDVILTTWADLPESMKNFVHLEQNKTTTT